MLRFDGKITYLVTVQPSEVIERGSAQIKLIFAGQKDKKIARAAQILVRELGKTFEQDHPFNLLNLRKSVKSAFLRVLFFCTWLKCYLTFNRKTQDVFRFFVFFVAFVVRNPG